MNVIDCMAIAPYYLTLFFMPQPEMGPIDPAIPTGEILKGFIQNNIQIDIVNFRMLWCSFIEQYYEANLLILIFDGRN